MDALTLVAVGFAGTLVWVANPEAAVVLATSHHRLAPLAIAALVTVGQATALALLYGGGGWLAARWPWFGRQCARVRERLGPRAGGRATAVIASSGLLGFPPASALSAVAPGLGLSGGRVFPLLLALRLVRFIAVALLAGVSFRL